MKKIILLFIILTAFSSPLFSGGSKDKSNVSIANFATGEISDYDKPLIDAMNYFIGASYSFSRIAMTLAAGLGFIGIVWCAFKIIFGTENIRKTAVDIMCKFLIFTFVMALYPKITYGILDTAINIGMHAGGGITNLKIRFLSFRKNQEQKVDVAKKDLERMLDAVRSGPNGSRTAITENLINSIVSRLDYNDDADKIIAEYENKYGMISNNDYLQYSRYRSSNGMANTTLTQEQIKTFRTTIPINSLNNLSKRADGKKAKAISQAGLKQAKKDGMGGWNNPAIRHAVISLKAMNEVFSKNPDYDPEMASSGNYTTEEYLFDPFMRIDKKQSNLLSPGAMIKIGVIIADIVNAESTMEFDADGNVIYKNITQEKSGNILGMGGFLEIPFKRLQEFIFSMFFTIGMILACVFCAIQYLMTIFEFFILSAVGIVFVPCVLWDGTKSFAAKLVTLFLAYFFKLMLMIFCLMWVYSFYIDMGITIMTSYPVLSLLNIGYFAMSIMLGWVVTQNGPKLATTLLNGTPDLSMGEFMRAAGTAMAGAYTAKKAYTGLKSAGQTAHKGLQKGVNTVAGGIAAVGGVNKAVDQMAQEQGWSRGKRFQKRVGAMLGLAGQGIMDSASTFFTGVEKRGSSENIVDKQGNVIDKARSRMGKGSVETRGGSRGEQTFDRAVDGAYNYTYEAPPNTPQNNQPQNNPPPDTPPSFPGQRDTDVG